MGLKGEPTGTHALWRFPPLERNPFLRRVRATFEGEAWLVGAKGFTMVIFVIAAGASAFFSLRITWLSQNVMEDVQEKLQGRSAWRVLSLD